MPSRDFETIEVFGKTLIYDIQIEEMQYRFLGHDVKTTKWLHLEDWLQLYEQLEERFSKCTSADLPEFTGEAIEISNRILAQVEKRHLDDFHRKLFADCEGDLSSICLRIKVKPQNFRELKERVNEVESRTLRRDGRSRSSYEKSYNRSEEPRNEYVPSTKNDTTSCMPYNPSKAEDVTFVDEPYSPKPISLPEDQEEVPSISKAKYSGSTVYKPSIIGKEDHKRAPDSLYSSKAKGVDKNRKRPSKSTYKGSNYSPSRVDDNRSGENKSEKELSSKSKRTEDLFGTDDSDNDKSYSDELRRKLKKSKKSKKSSSTKYDSYKIQEGGGNIIQSSPKTGRSNDKTLNSYSLKSKESEFRSNVVNERQEYKTGNYNVSQ